MPITESKRTRNRKYKAKMKREATVRLAFDELKLAIMRLNLEQRDKRWLVDLASKRCEQHCEELTR